MFNLAYQQTFHKEASVMTQSNDIPSFKEGDLVEAHWGEHGVVARQDGHKVWLKDLNYWWHALNLLVVSQERFTELRRALAIRLQVEAEALAAASRRRRAYC